MSKTDSALEFKSFSLKVSEVDETGRFEGYAAVFNNVDSQRDVIEQGAFKKTLQENPEVPILWQHDPYEPIGISAEMKEDDKGLHVVGQLAMDVQRGKEARALMQLGAIKGLSIGYRAIKPVFNDGVRHLKEIALKEWSPVTFPANQLAVVGNVKSLQQRYNFYSYDALGCLLAMIGAGSDFISDEYGEGDSEAVTAMQAILAGLADMLAVELSQQGTPEEAAEVPLVADAEGYAGYGDPSSDEYGTDAAVGNVAHVRLAHIFFKEGRVLSGSSRKLVEQAVESLQALLDAAEPPKGTRVDGAALNTDAADIAAFVASLRAA